MDPITTAILAAVAAGGAKAAERALTDVYSGLKTVIRRRFGNDSDLAKAVEAVEEAPEAKDRRETLEQEVARASADRDFSIYTAAQAVLDQIEARPDGTWLIQQVTSGRDTIYVGKGAAGQGSSYHEGHVYEGDVYYDSPSKPNLPKTTVGWAIALPGLVCVLLGVLIFFFSLIAGFIDTPEPGEGFPLGLPLGMGLFVSGVVVLIIAGLIDQVLASRKKK